MSDPGKSNGERPIDAESDAVVASAYRELAVETTPGRLDDAVLKAAAAEARPRYARAVRWLRPAAWAMTVGLSLAIVLELTVFSPPPEELGLPALEQAEPEMDAAAETSMQRSDDLPTASTPAAPTSAADQPGEAFTQELRDAARRETAFERQAPPAISSEALAIPDTRMLEEAEQRARLQQKSSVSSGALRAVEVSQFANGLDASADTCSAEARAKPETWLECILALESLGMAEIAEREREFLAAEFPDFVQE